jgi:transposase
MPNHTVLPDSHKLDLIDLSAEAGRITISAATAEAASLCPLCGTSSSRIHSRYVRALADLPWQGVPVGLRLHVRRFFCDAPSCRRTIFAERLPGLADHYARRTFRLQEWFTHVRTSARPKSLSFFRPMVGEMWFSTMPS